MVSNVKWDDKKLKKLTREESAKLLKKIGFSIMKDAMRMCAVDTGRLRASTSINWTGSGMSKGKVESPAKPEDGVGQPGGSAKEFTVVVGTNVEYAVPVEYGTGKMSAKPYLRPALRKNVKGK